jgi:hypothetical protein
LPVEDIREPSSGNGGPESDQAVHPHPPGDDRPTGVGEQPDGPAETGDETTRIEHPGPDTGDLPGEEQVRRQVSALLDGIENRPLAEHAQRYDEVHTELQVALTEIDGVRGG